MLNKPESSETIKIGFLGDLDGVVGKPYWQGARLAVEEINAEGGILGRQVELIGEDHDGGGDPVILTNALTKLIASDNVDFIVGGASGQTLKLWFKILLLNTELSAFQELLSLMR